MRMTTETQDAAAAGVQRAVLQRQRTSQGERAASDRRIAVECIGGRQDKQTIADLGQTAVNRRTEGWIVRQRFANGRRAVVGVDRGAARTDNR